MSIISERIYAAEGFTEDDVIMMAYLCSNVDKKDDPIDRATVRAFKESNVQEKTKAYKQTEIIGFNPNVKRVVAFVEHEGKTLTVAKGLPAKILDTAAGSADDHEVQWKVEKAGDQEFMDSVTETDRKLSTSGYKTIGVAYCEGDAREDSSVVWKFVGLLPMLDPPREDTRATVDSLHHANVSVKMITGDHVNVGKETARLTGLGTEIHAGEEIRKAEGKEKNQLIWDADGFASVLPSDKREVVLVMKNEFGLVTGMTGDGVNDAPALSAAQVGIAVDGATDAAKNAADLILTRPGLNPIYGAVLESRRIFARIKAYVVYRVAASIILVLTLSIIIFSTGCAVDGLLIIILALLNDISMIPVAYDNAKATTKPQMPDSRKLLMGSLFYGIVHSAAGLGFIYILADRAELKQQLDVHSQCTQATQGFIWFHLVLVTELMIFSVRAPSFFFLSMPSPVLVLSVLLTCIIGALISVYGTNLSGVNMAWVIVYNAIMLILVDMAKILFRHLIHDDPGDVIESDELSSSDDTKEKTDEQWQEEKQRRNSVHQNSLLSPADRDHHYEVRRAKQDSGLTGFFNELRPLDITDGFVGRHHRDSVVLTSSKNTSGSDPGTRGRRTKQFSAPV